MPLLTKENKALLREIVLTPISHLYGIGVRVRNFLYDNDILKSETFDVPVVVVGNLAVGGTGKTPHSEYIIKMLCSRYHIGVLSRGYKRETKGFILANDQLITPRDIGDEPYQIYRKFGSLITLAVCEDRREGIRQMLKADPEINLFVLDDAFQHRRVKPKVNILLTDYNNPPYEDKLLPRGRLREHFVERMRADMVIVTKCPNGLMPLNYRICKKGLDLIPDQSLYFSKFRYSRPLPVYPISSPALSALSDLQPTDTLLLVAGIAQPRMLVHYLREHKAKVKFMQYPDHYYFTREDLAYIYKVFQSLEGQRKFIITTEKDSVRILNNPYIPAEMKQHLYYIPIDVEFMEGTGNNFVNDLINRINKKESYTLKSNSHD